MNKPPSSDSSTRDASGAERSEQPVPGTETDRLLGAVLANRYRVVQLIAEGGMGKIYLGEHMMMQKRVAIKVLKAALGRVPEVVARFEREAMAAANIEHQNIAAATDLGRLADGSVFLVLEYLEGRGLRNVIAEGPLPLQRALKIVRQVASALAAAHAMNIVHRDLKPENVMLVERGTEQDFVKVLDFGIAKAPALSTDTGGELTITNPGTIVGTAEYMAPEQSLGAAVDARADVYSLGVLLYELLAGVVPYQPEEGILGQQLKGEVPTVTPQQATATATQAVNDLIRSMMAPDAVHRTQSAREVLRSIDAILGEADSGGSAFFLPGSVHALGAEPETIPLIQVPPALQRAMLEGKPAGSAPTHAASTHAASTQIPEGSATTSGRSRTALLIGVAALATLAGAGLVLLQSGKQAPSTRTPYSQPSSASDVAAQKAARATPEELSVAQAAGLPVLDDLAQKYPADPEISLSQARILSKQQRHAEAVQLVDKALTLDAALAADPRVASVLWAGAQSKAQPAALDLLLNKTGSQGADILYDLATTRGVRASTQEQAAAQLTTRAYSRAATPEASVAAELLRAPNCSVRKGLLLRARNVGDKRSLELLTQFSTEPECDAEQEETCNACLKQGSALQEAIEAISARTFK